MTVGICTSCCVFSIPNTILEYYGEFVVAKFHDCHRAGFRGNWKKVLNPSIVFVIVGADRVS
jgi:hypothetical protein